MKTRNLEENLQAEYERSEEGKLTSDGTRNDYHLFNFIQEKQGLQKLSISNTDQFLVGEQMKISNVLETNLSSYYN